MTAVLAGLAWAQDPVRVDSAHHRAEFENDRVRVLRVKLDAGESSPEHEHPARVTVVLRPADRAGRSEWSAPEKHAPRAVTALESVEVELKPARRRLESALPEALDPVRTEPAHYTVDFENQQVRVLRIRYGPGERSIPHRLRAGVVVYLTDVPGVGERGAARWEPATTDTFRNPSDAAIEMILVELK